MARHFGPAGFGKITLALTIINYVMVATNCGTDLYAVRTVATGRSTLEAMIPIVIIIRLSLSFLAFFMLAACVYNIPDLYESRHLILLFSVTLFSNSILLLWVPQAVHRTNAIAASNIMRQFLNLSLLYFLLLFNSNLYIAPAAIIY